MRLGIWFEGEVQALFTDLTFRYVGALLRSAKGVQHDITLIVSAQFRAAAELWLKDFVDAGEATVHIAERARNDNHAGLVQFILDQEVRIDVWWILQPDCAVANLFNKPCVSLFPSYPYLDCPSLFDRAAVEATIHAIRRNAQYIHRYVCFSDDVRQRQIRQIIPEILGRVEIVPQVSFCGVLEIKGTKDRAVAAERIRESLRCEARPSRDKVQSQTLGRVLPGFPYEECPYIFVPVRNMPHTNIRIIVEAAEMLARRYEPIKVILTAPLDWSSQSDPLMEAVRSKGLHWDVVSIDATLPAVYSALCQCAGITILPSPYERELSPVINDSLSLGTPVLLSDTPALRDALSADAAEHFAFDPLSPRDLADKIVSYLEDREAIVYRQRVLWPQQTESPSAIIARAEQVTEQALATHRATAGPHAPSPPGVAGLSPVKAIQVRKKLLSVVRPVSVWRAAMRALRRAGSISDARRGS